MNTRLLKLSIVAALVIITFSYQILKRKISIFTFFYFSNSNDTVVFTITQVVNHTLMTADENSSTHLFALALALLHDVLPYILKVA